MAKQQIVTLRKPKTFKATWKDRAGESTEYLATSSPIGPRIIVHRWLDTNEVIVRALTGDGWRNRRPFKEFEKIELQSPTAEEMAAAIKTCEQSLILNSVRASHSTHFA